MALTPGAGRLVPWLRERGLRLVLATASDDHYARHALGRHGLLEHFEFLLTKERVSRLKPDPEVYQLAQQRLGLEPASLLVVEDSEYGVAAAKAAGLPCWVVETPFTPPGALAEADRAIRSLEVVPTLLTEAEART